ncbi:response regulator transcription factor [Flavobacterium antarcticum]|uniref:response regulator n=1 Tax=Flavobacterium antarcticum TaxID=271155 RepID=UPI0003B43959|nr:response regulator transcription factor [Flavobacterium antarcticum]
MIRIVIAEDHQSLIDGIKLSLQNELDIQVIGEANDGEALIDLVRLKEPNVVITDIRMPKLDGISATRIIKTEFPTIDVIGFSMFDQTDAVAQMRDAGASGYIMKNSSLATLVEAIRTVAKKKSFFDSNLMIEKNTSLTEEIILSKRELEILRLIGEGNSSVEISELLFIGKATVDTHRKNILKKLNMHGKNDLVRYAVERKYDFT